MLARNAFRMRLSGSTMFEISEQLGITEGAAAQVLSEGLRKAAMLVTEGARADLLTLEVSRLDALQAAVWPAAMRGDARAVDSALKVIAQRAKYLGVDAANVENVNQTLVISGSSGDYIAALKLIASGGAADEAS